MLCVTMLPMQCSAHVIWSGPLLWWRWSLDICTKKKGLGGATMKYKSLMMDGMDYFGWRVMIGLVHLQKLFPMICLAVIFGLGLLGAFISVGSYWAGRWASLILSKRQFKSPKRLILNSVLNYIPYILTLPILDTSWYQPKLLILQHRVTTFSPWRQKRIACSKKAVFGFHDRGEKLKQEAFHETRFLCLIPAVF